VQLIDARQPEMVELAISLSTARQQKIRNAILEIIHATHSVSELEAIFSILRQRGSYQDPKSPSITYFPRPPHIVTRFRDNNGGLFAGGIDMYVESAEARTPDTVVQTVFELDSLNGGRVTAEKTLTRGEINETNLSEGNWKRKTTWRWRP